VAAAVLLASPTVANRGHTADQLHASKIPNFNHNLNWLPICSIGIPPTIAR